MSLPGLRIGHRIFLGLSIAAALMLIMAAVSIYHLRSVGQRLTAVAEQDRILQTSALELRVTVERENDGILSYLYSLSGDRAFLDGLSSASSDYAKTVTELEGLVKSGQERESLNELQTLHARFLELGNEQITLRDQGFPAAAAFLWQTEGSEAKGALTEGLQRFVDLQEEAISARVSDARSDQNRAAAISLGVVALGGLLGVVGAIALVRSITNPVKRLVATAEAIGRGDLKVRASTRGRDELAQLSSVINQMAEDLERSRGQMEQLFQEEQRRTEEMQAVVTSAPIVLFAIDREGVFTLSEGKALGDMGLEPGEVVGKSIFEEFAHHPDILEDARRALSGVEVTATVEERGSTFETRYSPIRGKYGDVIGVIGVATNITQRVQAEKELLQQTHELAVLGERNRMAREIHDTLAQGFTGIVLQLEAAEQALAASPAEAQEHLDRARSLARESLQEARRSVWDLRPQALEAGSLASALQEEVRLFVSAGRERASLRFEGPARELPAEIQAALLRICQESLTNVRRHAAATEVEVGVAYYPQGVSLSIRDNGAGFQPSAPPDGGRDSFGLVGMRERARLLGGTFDLQSEPGSGTTIEVTIPLS